MRYLDKASIENIAIGAAFLGTGGGGDPYIGKLMAISAVEKNGPVKLYSVDEIGDEDFFIPAALMGAPSVSSEKFPNGSEFVKVFQKLARYLGEDKIAGTYPMEAGGVNSMIPIVVAAQLGLPLIDCDGMGRAFPELQMVTFNLDGISATPMAITDEKGNIGIFETIDNKWTERLARAATVEMGASALVSLYPTTGAQMKRSGVHHVVTLSEQIGEIISSNHRDAKEKLHELLKLVSGYELFQGKIVDVIRETKGGFNLGKMDGQVVGMTPDLLCLVDYETLTPVTTESLKYGKRVRVIGLPAHEKWRTDKGIQTAGPRYFGYDYDYVPIEELVKKAVADHV